MAITSDNTQSIKFALLLFLITNRSMFGDVGFLAFYAICTWFIIKDGLYLPVFKYLSLMIIPIIIGVLIGFTQHGAYDVFKDVYYFLSPVFTTYVGCIIAKRAKIDVLKRAFLMVGIVTAIVYIIRVFTSVGGMALADPRAARYEGSAYVSCSVFLSIGVLLWGLITETDYTRKQHIRYALMFFINFIAIYISGSRTFWLTAIVFMAIVAWTYIKKRFVRFGFIGILVVAGIGAIIAANPNNTTVKVLLHSSDEMAATDFTTAAERNNNYRAYEKYRAMKQFNGYTLFEQVLGGGFGEKIDMVISPLGTRYIPILHNGYPYILVKTGYFGMICFFLFGFFLIRMMLYQRDYGSSDVRMFCYIAIGGVVASFIVNASVWGLFNDGYNILLMLSGAYIYYLNEAKKNETEVISV